VCGTPSPHRLPLARWRQRARQPDHPLLVASPARDSRRRRARHGRGARGHRLGARRRRREAAAPPAARRPRHGILAAPPI